MKRMLILSAVVGPLISGCGGDDDPGPAIPISEYDEPVVTTTTLSFAKEYKEDLDEFAEEFGYDGYDDFREDADRFEREPKAFIECVKTATDTSSCTPPEG
jgi:hypothetical protein